MRRLRIGLIGAGKHGQRYVKHVREDVPELIVQALCRQDAAAGREQASALGARFHPDWRALVADPEVDAVIAVVPPVLHPEIATAVAGAGKPLLIEKPLATTGADAVRVVRALAAVPALVAHTLRWNAVVGAMRERLPSLGTLRALVLNQRFEPSRLGWLDDPAVSGGGIILHTGVHSFDCVRYLTGKNVTRVWCRTSQGHTTRTEDNFFAQLELDGSPALVGVGGSRSTLGRSGLIDAAGDEGQLVGDHALHTLYSVRALVRTPVDLPDQAATVRDALRAFAALVLDGTPPRVRLEDGARAVQIAEACRRSAAADGAAVAVDPFPG